MTDNEKRENARQFYNYWRDKGQEDEHDQQFWNGILTDILGASDVYKRIKYQKKVYGEFENTKKRIDAYIPETRVLIEQKSRGIDLSAPQPGHDNMTPYQQAKKYSNSLTTDETPYWIVLSNFAEIWVYNMRDDRPEQTVTKFKLEDLRDHYNKFSFLLNSEEKYIKKEEDISFKAGDIVGKIYDSLLEEYIEKDKKALKSLNVLCTRIVFLLYAEDTGILGQRDMFHDYIIQYEPKHLRNALKDLFRVLNTPESERDPYDETDASHFPYVNGGLFADENIIIPNFTQEIKDVLIQDASESFDWSLISPTIFGSVFESTLSKKIQRDNGMHYTTPENIRKVIKPLFLDELQAEFEELKQIKVIATKKKEMAKFQNKLASLQFFDPACGSGNFLTESYLQLRSLENKVIRVLTDGQQMFGINPIKVSINQFHGIEINDFAVTVSMTALWIAEQQMMRETADILIGADLNFLPLTTNAAIHEGNALRIDWNDIVNKNSLSYIIGNPPFVGSSIKTEAEEQKKDKEIIFGSTKSGKLDYVACWYKKASDFIKGTKIKCAFVSTNSITQGEQVRPLWEDILKTTYINFAYRTFAWDSEAHNKAHVHCVIIGFSEIDNFDKKIFEGENIFAAKHINGYLLDSDDFYINSRSKNPDFLPKLTQGNKPWDDGGLILTPKERQELIAKYPKLESYIKRYMGSRDYINNIERYCLWFDTNDDITDIKSLPEIAERFRIVADIRLKSPTVAVRKQAETPHLFSQIRQPKSNFILVPETSSSNRRYIPMGFMPPDTIVSNSVMTAENATLYMFGILQSNVHMAWMRTVCGRLKNDYRYSPAVYNEFPWPNPTCEQKKVIEQTAQGIIDARNKYPDKTLDFMYSEDMPDAVKKAHNMNNVAVMKAYGFDVKDTSERICVENLIKLYQSQHN